MSRFTVFVPEEVVQENLKNKKEDSTFVAWKINKGGKVDAVGPTDEGAFVFSYVYNDGEDVSIIIYLGKELL